MLIDSHAHLDAAEFDTDREAVIERCKENQIVGVITCGTTLSSSEKNAELAKNYSFLFAAVGIHPHESYQMEAKTMERLKQLGQHEKVLAVGETGLDFHYNFSLPEVQKKSFRLHIRLARELQRPLIVHCRAAEEELVNILVEEKASEAGGVIHCFAGSRETANRCLDLGFYLGVSGIITFKTGKELAELFSQAPLERLLVETDAPYLAPAPFRGKRNEPAFVAHTAAKLAEIRALTVNEIHRITTENTQRLFHLPVVLPT